MKTPACCPCPRAISIVTESNILTFSYLTRPALLAVYQEQRATLQKESSWLIFWKQLIILLSNCWSGPVSSTGQAVCAWVAIAHWHSPTDFTIQNTGDEHPSLLSTSALRAVVGSAFRAHVARLLGAARAALGRTSSCDAFLFSKHSRRSPALRLLSSHAHPWSS